MEDNQNLYASSIVEQYTEEYAYENFKSFFPNVVDGCKCVYRRTIHAFQKAGIDDGRVVKSTRAVAEVITTHPTGDTSIYEVIMSMCQPWVINPPMMESRSNTGSYGGNRPGAQRYTEVKFSAYTKEMFLDDVDLTALPKVEGPLLELEPAYYIPALPTALLIDNLTIGFAISCLTTRLNFSNVCDIVKDYVTHQLKNPFKPWDYKKMAEKFIPDFPTPCVITNENQLIEAYEKGDFNHPIDLDGQVTITKNKILVEGAPHRTPFQAVIGYFEKHLREQPNGEIKKLLKNYNFNNSNKIKGNLSIYPKQGVSTLQLWKLIAPVIRFHGRYHPTPNYTLEDQITVKQMSYIDILNLWYKKRLMILTATKRRKLQKLQKEKQIIEAKMILVQYPDKVIQIFRESKNKEVIIAKLREAFDFTPFESNVLSNTPLHALTHTSMESLKEQKESIQKEIDGLLQSFEKVGEEIIEKAEYFKKKYGGKGRSTLLPRYKGYVEFEHGNVLFEDATQLEEILEAFPHTPCKVHQFLHRTTVVVGPNGKESKSNLHKYMWDHVISIPGTATNQGHTISIKEGFACKSKGIKVCPPQEGVFYTGIYATALHRNGTITRDNVENLVESSRKNCLTSQGAMTNIIHVVNGKTVSFYLLTFNTSEPNVIRIERIDKEKERYISNPEGKPYLFTSVTGKEWYITPPKECVNRFSHRVIRIVDAEGLLNGQQSLYIDLLSKNKRNASIQYLA